MFVDYFPHNSNGTIIIDESKVDYTKLELVADDIVDIIVSDGNDDEFEDDEEYDEVFTSVLQKGNLFFHLLWLASQARSQRIF